MIQESSLVVRDVYHGSDGITDEYLLRALQNSATTFHYLVSEIRRIVGSLRTFLCFHVKLPLIPRSRLAQSLSAVSCRVTLFVLGA